MSLLQCVGGRVSGCMSDRQAPRVTVLLISSPPPALKQHTLPPALPLGRTVGATQPVEVEERL